MKTDIRPGYVGGCIVSVMLLAVLLLTLLSGRATGFPRQSQNKPPEGARTGEVTVRVVFPDGTPVPGAAVVVARKRYTADIAGVVKVHEVAARSGVAGAEATRMEGGLLGFFRKEVRYAGFLPLEIKAGTHQEVRLILAPVADMDQLCRSCHPEKDAKEAGIIKCTHKSGVPVKPEQAARVASFNRENEELRKAGKPFFPSIVLEPRKVRKGLFSETKPFLVCGSCHTNHVETGHHAYALMPFAEKSVLCRGCHV